MRQMKTPLALIVLAVLTCGAAIATQQPPGEFTDVREIPDTAAGRLLRELVAVVNAGDRERTQQFIEANFTADFLGAFPMDEHLAVFDEVHRNHRTLELYGIRTYDPPHPAHETVGIARSALLESWRGIILHTTPDGRIAGLNFSPARPPKEMPPAPRLTRNAMIDELEAYLDRVSRAEAFSGAVLLAKDGETWFKRSYGLADRGLQHPNRTDTKFNLGSMNKMFTAVAVAKLAEQGKLSFTDPLSKYLGEDWLPREVTDAITIEHLLTHTSGLGSYFNETFMKSSRDLYRSVDDYKPLVAGDRPSFPPGSDWKYSNTGFLLLGAVIERATGQDYFDHVREQVYQPAGMKDSDCFEMDQVVPNLAIGYSQEIGPGGQPRWVNNLYKHVIRGGPAGGGFSTVDDLLRFDQAMRSGKLVSAATAELLWSPKPNSPEYGYGFGLFGSPSDRVVGHSGGFPGISATLDMHLDTGFTVIVLANVDGGATVVGEKVRELIGRLEPPAGHAQQP